MAWQTVILILTYSLHPSGDARTGHNLRHYQATHLIIIIILWWLLYRAAYIIEPLRDEADVGGLVLLVLLGPGLTQELPGNIRESSGTYSLTDTYSLLMENRIFWSKKVICSAISRALRVAMFSFEGVWNTGEYSCAMLGRVYFNLR